MVKKHFVVSVVLLSSLIIFVGCRSNYSTTIKDVSNNSSYQIQSNASSEGDSNVSSKTQSSSNTSGSYHNNSSSSERNFSVIKTEQFSNYRVLDWFDDDTFLYLKQNKDLQKVNGMYPESLYLHNVITGADTVFLAKEGIDIQSAKFSPDKNYVSYNYSDMKVVNGGVSYLAVINVKTKVQKELYGNQLFNSEIVEWVDNNQIMYNWYFKTYLVDLSGNITDFTKETGHYYNSSVSFINNNLYYIDIANMSSVGGNLYELDMATGNKKLLMHYAYTFTPSPDQKSAIVWVGDGSNDTLEIIDMDGNVKQIISKQKDTYTVRSSWSPDNNYIAYSIDVPSVNAGLYIFNTKSGVSTKIDNTFGVDYVPAIIWSPSSDKMAISNFNANFFDSKIFYLSITK